LLNHDLCAFFFQTTVCELEDGILEQFREWKKPRTLSNAAFILKVDVKAQKIVVDQVLDNVTIEDLQEEMPSAVPRYIVYAYKHVHKDERVSYQLVFIYYSPPQIKPELAMLYSSSLQRLYSQLEIQKVFDARKVSELNEKWLLEKLAYFGL